MADSLAGRVSVNMLRCPALWLCLLLFAANFLMAKLGAQHPLQQNYLNDLLCMPLVLSITLWVQRVVTFRQQNYTFTKYHIVIAVAYCSLLFELLFPLFMDRYTADWLDVLAYAGGGWFFYLFINREPVSRHSS